MSFSLDKLPPLKTPSNLTPRRYVFALVRFRPWLLLANMTSHSLSLIPGVLLPVVIGRGIETIGEQDWTQLWWWVLAVVVLGIVQAWGTAMTHFTMHKLWLMAVSAMQRELVAQIAKFGIKTKEVVSTGDITATISSDVNQIGNFPAAVGEVIGAMLVFGVAGTILVDSSPLLGVITLVGVPLVVLLVGPFMGQFQQRQRASRQRLGEVNTIAADIVSGLRILRGIGGEARFLKRFVAINQRARQAGVDFGRSEALLAVAETILPATVTVLITWFAARLAVDGVISVGELIAFYGISVFLIIPVSTGVEMMAVYSAATVSAEKICTILRSRCQFADPVQPRSLPNGTLTLYDSETDFTAAAGQLTVVDAGQSSEELARRLARFSEVTQGQQVLIDAIPIDQIALAELRYRVVYVHKQDLWFSGTVREQITADRQSTVDFSVALHAASAEDIVDGFPAGVDELVGERGREVSGGQRQRLNLARALALDADVLLLDEPTSAVDAHTESRIVERVKKLRQGKTTVVLSNSPLWINAADASFRVEMT